MLGCEMGRERSSWERAVTGCALNTPPGPQQILEVVASADRPSCCPRGTVHLKLQLRRDSGVRSSTADRQAQGPSWVQPSPACAAAVGGYGNIQRGAQCLASPHLLFHWFCWVLSVTYTLRPSWETEMSEEGEKHSWPQHTELLCGADHTVGCLDQGLSRPSGPVLMCCIWSEAQWFPG